VFGIGALEPVFEEGRGVKEGDSVANGVIFYFFGELVFGSGGVASPVIPEHGLIEYGRSCMKRCCFEHRQPRFVGQNGLAEL
jgi:hypothetical protein